jgi:hypothetical protein
MRKNLLFYQIMKTISQNEKKHINSITLKYLTIGLAHQLKFSKINNPNT